MTTTSEGGGLTENRGEAAGLGFDAALENMKKRGCCVLRTQNLETAQARRPRLVLTFLCR